MSKPIKFVALGIEHRHIFGMAQNMLDAGAQFAGWWTQGEPDVVEGFVKRFPDVPRAASKEDLLADQTIDLVIIADIPSKRADLAIAAMEAGKDVMSDKPGCTTFDQLERLRQTVAKTKESGPSIFPNASKSRASRKPPSWLHRVPSAASSRRLALVRTA